MKISQFQNAKTIRELALRSEFKIYGFSEVFLDVTSHATKIQKGDYLDHGRFPIVDQGKSFVDGYSNEETGLYTDIPAIVFGDHTLALKLIEQPIFLGADGVKLLKNKLSEETMLTKYAFYYLQFTNIPSTGYNRHFKYLKEIVIPLPPLPIQKKIVAVLDKAQELIDLRKQQLTLMDELIQSVFYEMFGGPVSNPKGWPICKLKDISTDIKYGSNEKGFEIPTENAIPVLRIPNILPTQIILKDLKYLEKSSSDIDKYRLLHDDLLVVRSNGNPDYIGRCAMFSLNGDYVYASYLIRIRLMKNSKVKPYFLQYQLATTEYRQVLKKLGTTTAGNYNINTPTLKELKFIVPPEEMQDQFVEIIRNIEEQKNVMQISLIEMENTFNSLMQQAFTGQLFTEDLN